MRDNPFVRVPELTRHFNSLSLSPTNTAEIRAAPPTRFGGAAWQYYMNDQNPSPLRGLAFLAYNTGDDFSVLFGASKHMNGKEVDGIGDRLWAGAGVGLTFIPGGKGVAGAGESAAKELVEQGLKQEGKALLSSLTSTTIEEVVQSSARLGSKGKVFEGGRAIAKKLGEAKSGGYTSAFDGIAPTQQNGEALIRSILGNPSRIVVGNVSIDVYNAAGQGVRYAKVDGFFIGFLEGIKATR